MADFDKGTRAKSLEWLLEGWIPRACLTIVEGHPGINKSSMLLDLGAHLTRGLMPCGTKPKPPHGVLLLNGEDSPEFNIKPRLKAANANLSLVKRIDLDELPSLATDLPTLELTIVENDIGMVILDPLDSFVGVDSSSNSEVRPILSKLKGLAERTGAAIVLVRHLSKAGGKQRINQGLGAIGIGGAARAVLRVDKVGKESDYRRMSIVKANNVREPKPRPFKIESACVEVDGIMVETVRIRWDVPLPEELGQEAGRATRSVLPREHGLPKKEHSKQSGKFARAAAWLRETLKSGPRSVQELLGEGKKQGFSQSCLERAKKQVLAESLREGKGWSWRLIAPPAEQSGVA